MIPRYTPPEISAIFSEESRLGRWLEVELLAAEGWAKIGVIPEAALPQLRKAVIDVERIAHLEAEQGHDVAAFVAAVQESVGVEGRYLHYGLTSSDIVDTALATQLRDAAVILDADCAQLEAALAKVARRHRLTLMPGRTHGVHAEPISFGVKMANHYDEVRRSRARLQAAAAEVAVGQLSGAVGTHASIPPQVEEHVCAGLNLQVAAVTTQVIARDRHAALVNAMALLASVLERIALTVRLLQISEVGEAGEPFSSKQKGSSAMPHKRNPILSERVAGLARVLRGHASTAMENVALWHERDISHSSAERVILPDACALTCYVLRVTTRIVNGLRVDAGKMRRDIDLDGGVMFSQRVLTALVSAGWAREDAYRAVQACAGRAREGGGSFRAAVEGGEIGAALDAGQLAACFDVESYLENIDITYARLGLDADPAQEDPESSGESTQPSLLAAEAGLGGGH